MYTAGQVPDIAESRMFQINTDLLTTHASVTNHDSLLVRVKLIDGLGDLAHGDEGGVINVADAEFPRFPYVQKQRFLTGAFHEFVKFNNVDVPHSLTGYETKKLNISKW
jgi:hypothetical protein